MEQKIRVGAVSYLNTKPMIYGLKDWGQIELVLDYPANIATALLNNTIDIGLVPVAVIPQLQYAKAITNFGISCTGAVHTVALFSNQQLHQITTIYLDYQSKTSVALVQILCKQYWNLNVKFINQLPNETIVLQPNEGIVIIGDRVFDVENKYAHQYDLGKAWFEFTQMPFVFAQWIANKHIETHFINEFNHKVETSLKNYFNSNDFLQLNTVKQKYLTESINYELTSQHLAGLQLFLKNFISN